MAVLLKVARKLDREFPSDNGAVAEGAAGPDTGALFRRLRVRAARRIRAAFGVPDPG
jgi:hypothetical protein